jgi:hypothetical protein
VVSAPCANDRIEHSLRLDYGKPDLEKFCFLGTMVMS